MKHIQYLLFISLGLFFLPQVIRAQPIETHPFSLTFNSLPQEPTAINIVPLLSPDQPFHDGGLNTEPLSDDDYQAHGKGGFSKMNGESELRYLITSGAWWLWAGDKPKVSLTSRGKGGAYSWPALLPHLGVSGIITLQVGMAGKKKNLEDFTEIKTILSPGGAEWQCTDDEFPISITLKVHPFVEEYGCALIFQLESKKEDDVELEWHYLDADHVSDDENYSIFSFDKYTQIFVGSKGNQAEAKKGVIKRTLKGNPGTLVADTLVCVWGYTGFDESAVDEAYKRLRFRPFPSREWTEMMKKNWFDHWIGRGLNPGEKFMDILNSPASYIEESRKYWSSNQERVSIYTGNRRFDNLIQSFAARAVSLYEYPGFLHAANYMKYGKINCGYYGFEAAGYHEEVESSLKFISGSQCVKGRQRYIMPNFKISQWAEEMNPYFIEQVWYHYLWTGDEQFLYDMWPSVRKALEHLISTSDPEHDGIFTGFYENWNGDGKSRGGRCSLWTAMGITALRCGYEMATLLEDVDWTYGQQNKHPPADNDFARRYKRLLDRAETSYETLYNQKTGAYASGEWNGILRNTPANEEINHAIWRGIGSMLRNYSSMRFIKEQYHTKRANGIVEYSNRDWPVNWSNHYASFADAMSSIASAARVNDIDSFWPLLKTASETAYTRSICTVRSGGSTHHGLESDQMMLMAVLDNVFGIKPRLGDNLIVIRPSFPGDWKNPEIRIPDISYQYEHKGNSISLRVQTPVSRALRTELPVRRSVRKVMVNGHKVDFDIRKEVNVCRIIVEMEPAKDNVIEIVLDKDPPSVSGECDGILNETSLFHVENAEIIDVHNPHIPFGSISFTAEKVEITPELAGKYTLFLELRKGNISWYHPLELTINKPWSIAEIYQAWTPEQQASQLSPHIDPATRSLHLKLMNNMDKKVSGEVEVEIQGMVLKNLHTAESKQEKSLVFSLDEVWKLLSPGATRFTVTFNGIEQEAFAINWEFSDIHLDNKSLSAIDLRAYNNINIRKLYGYDFKWRPDYTGAAVGADWREGLKIDEKGYRIFVPPVSLMNFGNLPEIYPFEAQWLLPVWPEQAELPIPFPFFEEREDAKNILALINTENNASIPSEAIIKLERPVSAEKIYLLTANLTKTCKSYYPGAEAIITYDSGDKQVIQLIPPYTMSSFNQPFCVGAFHIPLGRLNATQTMYNYGKDTGLNITDLTLDPERKVKQISLRCVASETVFGILGMSLLHTK